MTELIIVLILLALIVAIGRLTQSPSKAAKLGLSLLLGMFIGFSISMKDNSCKLSSDNTKKDKISYCLPMQAMPTIGVTPIVIAKTEFAGQVNNKIESYSDSNISEEDIPNNREENSRIPKIPYEDSS